MTFGLASCGAAWNDGVQLFGEEHVVERAPSLGGRRVSSGGSVYSPDADRPAQPIQLVEIDSVLILQNTAHHTPVVCV